MQHTGMECKDGLSAELKLSLLLVSLLLVSLLLVATLCCKDCLSAELKLNHKLKARH